MSVRAGNIYEDPEMKGFEEKTFPIDLSDGGSPRAGMGPAVPRNGSSKRIFVGRLGDHFGNTDVVLVPGAEIAPALIRVVEEYRDSLAKELRDAEPLLKGMGDDFRQKRDFLNRNKKASDALCALASKTVRLQRIKTLAMGIFEMYQHHDMEETGDIRPPELALLFPESFRSVSAASGVVSLEETNGSEILTIASPFYPPSTACIMSVGPEEVWEYDPKKGSVEPCFVVVGNEVIISFS